MAFRLYDWQLEALENMHNGSILCGGVGSGKSITALAYYYHLNGGSIDFLKGSGEYSKLKDPIKLYIITTAKKRDSYEWEKDMGPFLFSTKDIPNDIGYPDTVIDSWNNIGKYTDVKDAFFIFDEQRITGKGTWVKCFYKIAKANQWILLTATPGDVWIDYIPVFVANGFYKNRTQFADEHIIYNPHVSWASVSRYVNTKKLERLRDSILIDMDFERTTVPHHIDIDCQYNVFEYKQVVRYKTYADSFEPLENASAYCYELRKVVNRDVDRATKIMDIYKEHPRLIIFYNFDYELDILRKLDTECPIAEWNGHKHESIPFTDSWIYLVQYTSGNEGWNCIETDTIIFYSLNYSYKMTHQAAGRIDRLNTKYKDLYYYHLMSKAPIDLQIKRCLKQKKNFNESRFTKSFKPCPENELLKKQSNELYFKKKYGEEK